MIEFIDSQIAGWPLARRNYQALGKTERRSMQLGDLIVGIQHNPARMVSTSARIDKTSLEKRPCFLCSKNRPPEQSPLDIADGWELLLNPYPIFPTHFTIVSSEHRPQEGFPLYMVEMAEKLPQHTVFFNGSKAGASCPDHLHCQAVKTHELPLMRLVESRHIAKIDYDGEDQEEWRIATPKSLNLDVPFGFTSIIITPDLDGMHLLADIENIMGKRYVDEGRINVFVWIDDAGLLRIVCVPRAAHRPSCYGDGEGQMMISPGCIDMAGVVIAPRREDYESLTESQLRQIFAECGCGI